MKDDDRTVIAGLRLKWREFRAPGGEENSAEDEIAFGLWVPDCNLDALLAPISQGEFVRSDERMPYFGAIWPAAEALVAKVLAGPPLDGARVLDLGCGLGVCGLAAARRGARVTFFDWEPRALEIVAASARVQPAPIAPFAFVVADWRQPPPCGPFDRILGADVLYEACNGPAVAAFVGRHLQPGAEAWLADPGRPYARQFLILAHEEGLELLGTELLAIPPYYAEVTLLRLRRPRA